MYDCIQMDLEMTFQEYMRHIKFACSSNDQQTPVSFAPPACNLALYWELQSAPKSGGGGWGEGGEEGGGSEGKEGGEREG